ncbi:MAG: LysE family transporter [Desulfobacterales bacterium]
MFWEGLATGFLLCAPLGPIGILCLQRTLVEGRAAGVLAVLGAAVVDAAFALLAGWGLALLNPFLLENRGVIYPAAGAVLAGVGIRVFRRRGSGGARRPSLPDRRVRSLPGAFFTSAGIMLSNPLPILVLSAVFSALPPRSAGPFALAGWVAGVFAGSSLWAPLLVLGAGILTPLVSRVSPLFLSRLSGAALFACGLVVAGAPWFSAPP